MKTVLSLYVLWLGVALALLVGWVMNAVAVIHLFTHAAPITTMFIGRIVGLFVPFVGGILGYC